MQSSISLSQSGATKGTYIHDVEHYLGRITSIIAHVVFIIFLIRFFVLEFGATDGVSMAPTLKDNTIILVEKISPVVIAPQRFDIIQHIEPIKRERSFVKRVIGLPGETIMIKENAIFVTPPGGEEYRLPEPYLNPSTINSVPYHARREFALAENEYFVLGDNRMSSNDSRAYGPVHRGLITGKIFPIVLQ